MKPHIHTPFISILAFFSLIHLPFTIASFLPSINSTLYLSNLQDSKIIKYNVSDSTQPQLPSQDTKPIPTSEINQTQAFTHYLAASNYSTAWYTKGTSYNETAAGSKGFIVSSCKAKTSEDISPRGLYCTLTTFTSTQDSSSSEILGFYVNQSSNYSVDSQNSAITFNEVPTSMKVRVGLELSFNSSKNMSDEGCRTIVTYSFINGETNLPFDYTKDSEKHLGIKVSVVSVADCELNVNTPLLTSSDASEAWQLYAYVILMAGIGLVQLFSTGVMISRLIQSDNLARKTAVGTLSFLISFDFFIYLLHFNYWTLISDWMAPILVIFFLNSVFLEPALLYYVFTNLKRRSGRAVVTVFYKLYFWMLVSGACLIISLTCLSTVIFYAYPCFLLPQIIDVFTSGQRYRWNYWFVFGLGIPKLFYISYLYLVPNNLFDEEIDYSLVIYSFALIIIELAVLQLQTKWPRLCFGSNDISQHSYECNEEETNIKSSETCSICMELLGSKPLISVNNSLLGNSVLSKTPCRHYYHRDCLQGWTIKKLECPNCRQEIPPYDEDD